MKLSDLDSAIIACVVPNALFDLRMLCVRYLKCEPLVIGTPEVPFVAVDNVNAVINEGLRSPDMRGIPAR